MSSFDESNWYMEVPVACSGFVVASFFVGVILSKLVCSSAGDEFHDVAISMKISICLFYACYWILMLSHMMRLFCLPIIELIAHSVDADSFCFVVAVIQIFLVFLLQAALSNLLLEKLHIGFEDSIQAVNVRINYGLRILALISWSSLFVLAIEFRIFSKILHPAQSSIGTVCASGVEAHDQLFIPKVASVAMVVQLVLFWTYFCSKLWSLLKKFDRRVNNEPILEMMRTHTVMLTVMMISFPLCVALTGLIGGSSLVILNLNVLAVALFLTHSFSRYYFKLLHCRGLVRCCFAPVEGIMLAKLGWKEEKDTIASRFEHSIQMERSTKKNGGEFKE